MARPRKILADYSRIDYGPGKTFNFDDEAWAALLRHVPAVGDLAELRREIEFVCGSVIGIAKINRVSGDAATAAIPAGRKAKPAALERLVAALQEAEQAWQEMRAAGFLPSAFIDAEKIGELAAQGRALLEELPDATRTPVEPWPILVRCIAAVFRRTGQQPGATKRVYEGGQPTWFQEFVRDLNDHLPDVWRPAASPEAFYSAVAAELSEPATTDAEAFLTTLLTERAAAQQRGEK